MRITILLSSLLISTVAFATYVQGPDQTGVLVFVNAASCPQGYTDVTATYQGRYIVGKAATGAAGDTLGSAIATTTTDSSFTPAGSITCTDHVAVQTAGVTGYCSSATPPSFSGSAASTMRSTIAPSIALRVCSKT